MKFQKILSFFLIVLLLCTAVVGCNAPITDETTTSSKQATEEKTTESPKHVTNEETTNSPSEEPSETISEGITTDAVTTEEVSTEGVVTEEPDVLSYEIYKSSLAEIMQDMLDGNTMKNETVMFIDYGDVKSLMYHADEIISVTSYDGLTTYTEGVDYALEDGKIVLLEGSSIPCITSEVYYNYSSDYLTIEHNGKVCNVYWGEGRTMTQWQVNVTYTHSDAWEGYRQANYLEIYKDFVGKLCRGENVTVIFYGDSIARGANSSSFVGHEPYQPDYTKLFVYALADLFNYRVKHIHTELDRTFEENFPTYNNGNTRGTITYINSSVGGWGCSQGLEKVQEYVIDVADFYGCDLFVINFGMNNGTTKPKTFQSITKQTLNAVIEAIPDTSIMIVSSMLSNPYDTDSGKNQILFEEPLVATADGYTRAGTPCALVCMASMSESILEHKAFNDYAANNINHPNDFFMRVYAQTLLQALIGYENMK